MCIIIYKEAGKKIKDEWIDNSAESNPDGFGMSYLGDDGLEIFKTMDYKEFKNEFRRLETKHSDSSFVLHFRKNTAGLNTVDNCHPFKVGDMAMYHNGTISHCRPDKGDNRSDTSIYAEEVISNLPVGWYDNETMLDMIERDVIGSKLLFHDEEGGVTILNESSGHWFEGLWMSNYSYYPNTKSVQKTKPVSWNSNVGKSSGNTYKPYIYKHPCGTYSKFATGVRYKWLPGSFMWAEIDNKGAIVIAGKKIYSDPPSKRNHTIINVVYELHDERRNVGAVTALTIVKNKQKAEQMVLCDWCGEAHLKSKVKPYVWNEELQGVDDPEEVQLICDDCCEDIGLRNYMDVKHNCNIDFYLCQRQAQSVWDAI